MNIDLQSFCPCGSGKSYGARCRPCHDGSQPAPDAEALMRSRYAAFVLGDAPYLLATWHASTRPGHLDLEEDPVPRWLGLRVKRHEVLGPDLDQARVESPASIRLFGDK